MSRKDLPDWTQVAETRQRWASWASQWRYWSSEKNLGPTAWVYTVERA